MVSTHLKTLTLWLALSCALGTGAAVDPNGSQDFYENAVKRFRAGSYSEAAVQLRNALQKNPTNLPARVLFGETLLKLGQANAAIDELERARDMGADRSLLVLPLARAFLSVARPEDVLAQFDPESYDDTVAGELLLLQGEAHLQLGGIDKAGEAFKNALARLPLDPRPLLGQTRIALAEGRFTSATALMKKATLFGSDSYDVWLLQAILLRDTGSAEAAMQAFDRALALRPDAPRALTARAALWIDKGERAKAKADLDKASSSGSATLETIYLRALLLFSDGEPEEAKELLRARAQELLQIRKELRPMFPNAELMLGVVSYFEGQHQQAAQHLEKYLRLVPRHRGATRYLAGAYLALGHYDDVIALFENVDGADMAQDPLALALLAEAYRASGNLAEAEKQIERAYQAGPALAGVGLKVAMGRLAKGQAVKALSDLEALAKKFPEFVEARAQLARGYLKTGRIDDAAEVVKQLRADYPDNSRVSNLMGTVLLASGDVEAARAEFQRAGDANPDLILPRVNLARLARIDGDPRDAENRFRAILKDYPGHPTSSLELASLMMKDGRLNQAAERLDSVISSSPNRFNAYRLRLEVMFASDQTDDDVITLAEGMLRRFPDDPRAHALAARSYQLVGMAEPALTHFRNSVSRYRSSDIALYKVAMQQFVLGDLGGASRTLAKVSLGHPKHLGVSVLRATVATQLKQFDTARSIIDQAVKHHGTTASLHTTLGDWYMAQSKKTEAVGEFEKAFARKPTGRTLETLFRAKVAVGDIGGASELMEEWMLSRPQDYEARHLYGQLLTRERRWERAREVYESLRIDGIREAAVLNNLAVAYQRLGDRRALSTAKAAYAEAPEDVSVLDTYGWLLSENGRPKEGLKLLRDAYSRAPDEAVIRYHIGATLARIEGREVEAIEELTGALADAGDRHWADDAKRVLDEVSAR